jgi:GT2 family glycosyltransferase
LQDRTTAYGRRLTLSLPPDCAGAWCRLAVRARAQGRWWAKLEVADAARAQVVREIFLGPVRRRGGGAEERASLVHVPLAAGGSATLHLFGEAAGLEAATVRVMARPRAALHLLLAAWPAALMALRGSARGRAGRLRAALGYAAWLRAEAPPYARWIEWFEPEIRARWEAGAAGGPGIEVAILGGPAEAVAATWRSAAGAPCLAIASGADWRRSEAPWVAILQAGEHLAPGAVACLRAAAARAPDAPFVFADVDALDASGRRHDPQFKPEADPLLLASGILTRGVCLFPGALVRRERPSGHADAVRLALALAQSARPQAPVRLPVVLTHRSAAMRAADPASLQAVVRRHLARTGQSARVLADALLPVRVRYDPAEPLPSVTVVIPSACREPHVARCIEAVARGTRYPNLDLVLAVQSATLRDPAARATLAALRRLDRLSVVDVGEGGFNYSRANNRAASAARGDLLLLLNDDVAPIDPDWLTRMVAHLADPAVGAVGARLLYGNDRVQHAGIVMGMTNLCEHADRMRPRRHAGPQGIARVDRCVSAVTAACLLTRAATWRALGGLDEGFAIALNDVDFCLRLGRTGARIVYAAGAELHHYESLSLGRHYAGERAGLEGVEVQRLRERWASAIAEDPHYSPNASLQSGREWAPAFPPRVGAPAPARDAASAGVPLAALASS